MQRGKPLVNRFKAPFFEDRAIDHAIAIERREKAIPVCAARINFAFNLHLVPVPAVTLLADEELHPFGNAGLDLGDEWFRLRLRWTASASVNTSSNDMIRGMKRLRGLLPAVYCRMEDEKCKAPLPLAIIAAGS